MVTHSNEPAKGPHLTASELTLEKKLREAALYAGPQGTKQAEEELEAEIQPQSDLKVSRFRITGTRPSPWNLQLRWRFLNCLGSPASSELASS